MTIHAGIILVRHIFLNKRLPNLEDLRDDIASCRR